MQLNGDRSYIIHKFTFVGRDSVDGTTIPHGLESPGIETRWGRDFLQRPIPALGSTQHPVQWVPSLFSEGIAAGEWR
jgi:hypothetical protein